jgi:hypothetical protein
VCEMQRSNPEGETLGLDLAHGERLKCYATVALISPHP